MRQDGIDSYAIRRATEHRTSTLPRIGARTHLDHLDKRHAEMHIGRIAQHEGDRIQAADRDDRGGPYPSLQSRDFGPRQILQTNSGLTGRGVSASGSRFVVKRRILVPMICALYQSSGNTLGRVRHTATTM